MQHSPGCCGRGPAVPKDTEGGTKQVLNQTSNIFFMHSEPVSSPKMLYLQKLDEKWEPGSKYACLKGLCSVRLDRLLGAGSYHAVQYAGQEACPFSLASAVTITLDPWLGFHVVCSH